MATATAIAKDTSCATLVDDDDLEEHTELLLVGELSAPTARTRR